MPYTLVQEALLGFNPSNFCDQRNRLLLVSISARKMTREKAERQETLPKLSKRHCQDCLDLLGRTDGH